MSEYNPVTTLTDLDTLDDVEVVEGYHDGRSGSGEPGNNRSRSYWHGWRNGRVDGHHQPKDAAQAELAHEYLRRERDRRAAQTEAEYRAEQAKP